MPGYIRQTLPYELWQEYQFLAILPKLGPKSESLMKYYLNIAQKEINKKLAKIYKSAML